MKKTSITGHRQDYSKHSLDEASADKNPIRQFSEWLEQASQSGVKEPHAFTLSTASRSGKPSARILLLRDVGEKGFIFYTNYNSRKGAQLKENPFAAMTFFWQSVERQVRVEGKVIKLSAALSDKYFNSRPYASRVSAVASPQSKVVKNRQWLEESHEALLEKYPNENVPRPAHWGGYLLIPSQIEFWQGRPNRLHDRLRYTLRGGKWKMERLAP